MYTFVTFTGKHTDVDEATKKASTDFRVWQRQHSDKTPCHPDTKCAGAKFEIRMPKEHAPYVFVIISFYYYDRED